MALRVPSGLASLGQRLNEIGFERTRRALAGLGLSAFVYVLLLIFFGVRTLRNGHGLLFFLGIFFPLLWFVGALMRPAAT